jgi:transposase
MDLRLEPEDVMSWCRGQTYSQDLRDRVLAAVGSVRVVAARFGVSPSYVVKVRQRRDRDGSLQPRPQKPPMARLLVDLHPAIASRVAETPEMTLADLRQWLRRRHGVSASITTVWTTLRQLGLTLKKSRSGPRNKAGRILHAPARPGANCSPS